MAYQQLLSASETLYGPFFLRQTLLEYKQRALQQRIMLPDDFIASVEQYAERNIISSQVGKTKKIQKEVCPHCLKAFILEEANNHELADEAKVLLSELFKKENLGHNGYYLDKDDVRKVLP
jgi:hypothetical protein